MRLFVLLFLSACATGPSSSLNAGRTGAELTEEETNQPSCDEELDACINGPGNDGSDGDCYETYDECVDEHESDDETNQPSCDEELDACINGPGNDGSDGDCYETYDACVARQQDDL